MDERLKKQLDFILEADKVKNIMRSAHFLFFFGHIIDHMSFFYMLVNQFLHIFPDFWCSLTSTAVSCVNLTFLHAMLYPADSIFSIVQKKRLTVVQHVRIFGLWCFISFELFPKIIKPFSLILRKNTVNALCSRFFSCMLGRAWREEKSDRKSVV